MSRKFFPRLSVPDIDDVLGWYQDEMQWKTYSTDTFICFLRHTVNRIRISTGHFFRLTCCVPGWPHSAVIDLSIENSVQDLFLLLAVVDGRVFRGWRVPAMAKPRVFHTLHGSEIMFELDNDNDSVHGGTFQSDGADQVQDDHASFVSFLPIWRLDWFWAGLPGLADENTTTLPSEINQNAPEFFPSQIKGVNPLNFHFLLHFY